MTEHHIGAVLVTAEARLEGIFHRARRWSVISRAGQAYIRADEFVVSDSASLSVLKRPVYPVA